MRILAIALALLCSTVLPAQEKQKPPTPGTPRNFSIPEVRRFELANGLNVRFVSYGEVPKATVRLVTQTGNVDESEHEMWLADLTGALMKQGTTSHSAQQLARKAAMMGGALDVVVGMNQTTIGADVFSESTDEAVAMIADVVRNPLFPEADLGRIKADLVRDLSIRRSQPGPIAAEKFSQVLFGKHAYGRAFPTDAALQGYTLEQVRSFHARSFGAARSFLYVVGRFDTATLEQVVRQHFGAWPAGSPPSQPQVTPVSARSLHLIDRPGAVQSTVYIGLPVVDATHPDYLALTVMNALLGGSFGSRITSNIREQKGYTYSPGSTITTRLGAAAWVEMADVTTNVTGASIHEILKEIDRLRNEPPSADELRGIQNYLAGNFVLRNSSRANIAMQLAFIDLYGLSDDYVRTYVQNVYALTPADVQRLAKTYIDPAKLAIVVVGDREKVAEQVKPYGVIGE